MVTQRTKARRVVVSAADHGIGRETAIWLSERGHHVLALGRDLSLMEDMPRETAPGGLLEINPYSPAESDAHTHALQRAVALFGGLDAVVCTGGVARRGPVEEVSDESAMTLLRENYLEPLRLIRPASRVFREAGHGRIICLSAGTGRIAMPMSGPYSASRYALEGLCDALRLELRTFGVHVALIEPGLVRDRVIEDEKTTRLFEAPPQSPTPLWPPRLRKHTGSS